MISMTSWPLTYACSAGRRRELLLQRFGSSTTRNRGKANTSCPPIRSAGTSSSDWRRDLWIGRDPSGCCCGGAACSRKQLRTCSNMFASGWNGQDRSRVIWKDGEKIDLKKCAGLPFLGIFKNIKKYTQKCTILVNDAPGGSGLGRSLFVLFPLSHFDGRPPDDVGNEKIHENVLAIVRLFDSFEQKRAQPLGVEMVEITVVEGSAGQYDRIFVRPFGGVAPCALRGKHCYP